MNLGNKPFFLNKKNELNLRFSPILPGWLFDRKGNYSFNFLGKIPITYHNPKRKDTFVKNAAIPKKIVLTENNGNSLEFASDTIPAPYAEQTRSRQVKSIDVFLE